MAETHGYRIVKIVRVPVDDKVYKTATDASIARDALFRANGSDAEYAVVHTSYPVETS